jgi:hypothetical protein
VLTLGLSGQKISQMVVVHNLESAVDDSGFSRKHVLGTAHSTTLEIFVCTTIFT